MNQHATPELISGRADHSSACVLRAHAEIHPNDTPDRGFGQGRGLVSGGPCRRGVGGALWLTEAIGREAIQPKDDGTQQGSCRYLAPVTGHASHQALPRGHSPTNSAGRDDHIAMSKLAESSRAGSSSSATSRRVACAAICWIRARVRPRSLPT